MRGKCDVDFVCNKQYIFNQLVARNSRVKFNKTC